MRDARQDSRSSIPSRPLLTTGEQQMLSTKTPKSWPSILFFDKTGSFPSCKRLERTPRRGVKPLSSDPR